MSELTLTEPYMQYPHQLERYALLDNLLANIELDKGFLVENLESAIYDLTDEQVERVIETGHTERSRVGRLRPYQTQALNFLLLSGSLLLCDSVGLGKTPTLSSYINYLDKMSYQAGVPFSFVYFTENALLEQTRREIVRFTGKKVLTVTGQADDVENVLSEFQDSGVRNFHGLVASYSATASFGFMKWFVNYFKDTPNTLLAIDESGILSSGERRGLDKVQINSAMRQLRDLSDFCVLADATPFTSDVTSLYNQLKFLYGSSFPTKREFFENFVETAISKNRAIIGYKNEDAFKYFVKYCMFGSTRKELGVSVNDSSVNILMYELHPKQREVLKNTRYSSYVYEYMSWFGEPYSMEHCQKLFATLDLIKSLTGKVVLYCKFQEVQSELVDLLASEGISSLVLNGDCSRSEKRKVLRNFEEDSSCQVLVTNIIKGLNLGYVPHLVFYTMIPTASTITQIEGRIIRSEHIKSKNIYFVVASVYEHSVFDKLYQNVSDGELFTKSEVSLVKSFLQSNYKDLLKKSKNLLLKGDTDYVMAKVYYADGLDKSEVSISPFGLSEQVDM